MESDLATLTDAQLAERAAKAMGWTEWSDPDFWQKSLRKIIQKRRWSPSTDDNQAAELMRFAVAKVGATKFCHYLFSLSPETGWLDWLATADARARTIAAILCLESTDPKPENERGE